MTPSFQKRLISAIVMICGMTLLFWLGPGALQIFVQICMILIQYETIHLMFPENSKNKLLAKWALIAVATAWGPFIGFLNASVFIFLALTMFQLLIVPIIDKQKGLVDYQHNFKSLGQYIITIFYALLIPSHIYLMLKKPQGIFWFLFLLVTTLGSDTFAYFSGKKFGKTSLNPQISPNKTLEGSIGGVIGAVALSSLFIFYKPDLPFFVIIFAAAISAILGQVGDLFESLLKRAAGAKDSGNLIPGHGGVLDRVDAIIFASPWVYWVSVWLA